MSSTDSGKDKTEELTPTIAEDCTWIQSMQLFRRPSQVDGNQHEYNYAKGSQIGPFAIEGPLGRGAMGEVYEAIDQDTERRVALKILPSQSIATADRKESFLSEGKRAASIRHPNSLFIYSADETGGVPYIAMELCTGGNLRELVERHGTLEQNKAADFTIQICQGLTAAHGMGIIHRDIKPANCFLTSQGEVIVGDYGLSVSTLDIDPTQLTADGTFAGTPAFASPEQIKGQELDLRADIYSVGASLFYLLSGETPFEGYSVRTLFSAIKEKDPSEQIKEIPNISAGMTKVISRCLQKDPAKRYQNYFDLVSDLEQFSSTVPQPANVPRRLMSGFIDLVLIQAIFHSIVPELAVPGLFDFLLVTSFVVITGVFEGLTGMSPGKALLGIKVQDSRGAVPGLSNGLLRASILYLPSICLDLLSLAIPVVTYSYPVVFFLAFIPARKGNYWAGFHDQFTKTRVVYKLAPVQQTPAILVSDLGNNSFGFKLGPYLVNSEYNIDLADGTVLLGFDPILQRRVWVCVREVAAPEISTVRRDLSVPYRLRWLNSKRSVSESWDVYEALEGSSLSHTASSNICWEVARTWLQELTEAAVFNLENLGSSEGFRSDKIWITPGGHLVILDFVAPGLNSSKNCTPTQVYANDMPGLQKFLIELNETSSGCNNQGFKPRFPLSFSKLQEKMKSVPFESMVDLKSGVDNLFEKTIHLNWFYRLKMMAVFIFFAIFTGIPFAFVVHSQNSYLNENHPQYQLTIACLNKLKDYALETEPLSPESQERIWALKAYLAGPLRRALPDVDKTISGFEVLPYRVDALFQDVLASTAEPTAKEITKAEEILSDMVDNPPQRHLGMVLRAFIYPTFHYLFRFMPIWIVLGILFKGGVMYQLFGVAIVSRKGFEASRIRIAGRTLIAWSPMLFTWLWIICFTPYFRLTNPRFPEGSLRPLLQLDDQFLSWLDSGHPLPVLMLIVFVFAGVWAIVYADRGLHDRLAGTYLVPR